MMIPYDTIMITPAQPPSPSLPLLFPCVLCLRIPAYPAGGGFVELNSNRRGDDAFGAERPP